MMWEIKSSVSLGRGGWPTLNSRIEGIRKEDIMVRVI